MKLSTEKNESKASLPSRERRPSIPVLDTIFNQPPNDIEMYVQEIGCGGRDGESTVAVVF